MDSLSLIREFVHERIGVEPARVVPEAVLETLGVDSLMLLELIFEFEQRFHITLPAGLKSPRTVSEMVTMMDRLRNVRQP
jgi:acyl carrier protein